MRHAVNDLANAGRATIFDDRFQRRDHGFAAIQAEAFRADIFLAEESFVTFAANNRSKDRFLAFGGKLDRFARAFEFVLQEAAFFRVRNMHVFKADRTAIGCAQAIVELAHCGPFQAQNAADEHLFVFFASKTVEFQREVFRRLVAMQTQWIKICRHMSAHTVKPHECHGFV